MPSETPKSASETPAVATTLTRDIAEHQHVEQALQHSLAHFKALLELAVDGVHILDQDGNVVECSRSFAESLGYSLEEALALNVSEWDAQFQSDQLINILRDLIRKPDTFETRHRRKDGSEFDVEINARGIELEGKLYLYASSRDITMRKQMDYELRLAGNVFDNALDGIMVTEPDGVVIRVNPAFEHILGYRNDELVGQHTRILQSGAQDDEFYSEMWKSIQEKGSWQGEILDRHKDGRRVPLWLSISTLYNASGEAERRVATLYDISQQKTSQEHITRLAHYDVLTGLPNRSLCMDRLEHALARAKRESRVLAVLFIDLDNFKQVNDTYGHPTGDALLCQIAERLQSVSRHSDTIGRLSGDEFMMLVEDVAGNAQIQQIAERIVTALTPTLDLGVCKHNVSASIGIASFPDNGEDVATLLKHADLAMYRSKDAGKNQYHFYSREMSEHMLERMQLLRELQSALENGQLTLYFQAVVDTRTRRCVGVEALARWPHEADGWIPPDKFIAIAEEGALIHPLGEWVLRSACEQMKAWLDKGLALDFISVNISGKQVTQGNLVDGARKIFQETGCPAQRVCLELTESFVMEESDAAIRRLQGLRDLGVSIAIDDFGTGYSSLSYLKRLPVTRLKLDRSFVRDIPHDPNDIAIARAILRLGQAVGMDVVAEGTETAQQHAFLLEEGCSLSQGYLYAKPMPAAEFEVYLQSQN